MWHTQRGLLFAARMLLPCRVRDPKQSLALPDKAGHVRSLNPACHNAECMEHHKTGDGTNLLVEKIDLLEQ